MGGLFQSKPRDRDWQAYAAPPPPPRPVIKRRTFDPLSSKPIIEVREPEFVPGTTVAAARPFEAILDVCEVDDRDQAGGPWPATGRMLSRSNLVFKTKRMCYEGRRLLVAVHMIDDRPVLLFGHVTGCDYQGAGQYLVDLKLAPIPDRHELRTWAGSRS